MPNIHTSSPARQVTFPGNEEQAKRFVETHPNLLRDVAVALGVRASVVSRVVYGRDHSSRIVRTLIELEPKYRVRAPRRQNNHREGATANG